MNAFLAVCQSLKAIAARIFTFLKLPERERPKGRKPTLGNSEAATAAILKQKQSIVAKKPLFEILEPPCQYNAFARAINGAAKRLAGIISMLLRFVVLSPAHPVKAADWTDVPVCLPKNARHRKTMRALSGWPKNGKGWLYGLKLHLSADLDGNVPALCFTSANERPRCL